MSLGTDRVRFSFNPSQNDTVSKIKQASADLIDLCGVLLASEADDEVKRLWSLAMTHFEDAAMWAVKAATAPPK